MLVTEAMDKYYAHAVIPDDTEWDTKALHASDLSFCPTAIWARRNGKNTIFVDADKRRQMAFGKLWEQEVAAALRFAGIDFIEQVEVKGSLFGVAIECHADFDMPGESVVIEAKTSEFWQGWKKDPITGDSYKYTKTPDDVKVYHKRQAAAAAMLLGRDKFIIPMTDRNKGGQIEIEFETAAFVDEIRDAIEERKFTRPGDPPPTTEPKPSFDFECFSCGFAACARNKNPFLQVIG